jgi:non-specific serine/threonine protein kinase
MQGLLSEVRGWLERSLPKVPHHAPEYGSGLWLTGLAALMQNDLPVAVERLTAAGAVAERTGDPVTTAHVNSIWGIVRVVTGDYPGAIPLLSQAQRTFRDHGVIEGELFATRFLGLATGVSGDPAAAREILGTGLARSTERGEIYFRGWLLDDLATVEMIDGHLDAAEAIGREGLRLQAELRNTLAQAMTIDLLARVAVRRENFTRAATLFGIGDIFWTAIGAQPIIFPAFGAGHARYVKRAKDALSTRYDHAYAAGRIMTADLGLQYAMGETPAVPTHTARTDLLTPRESEIADLVAEGLTNREIAARLTIAQRTAETHVEHILTKLSFNTRAQIAAWSASSRQS